MARARRVVEMGHRARDVAQVKVRQPLAGATAPGPRLPTELESIVLDELNLKSLSYGPEEQRDAVLDTNISRELRLEGLARELVRRIQESRKNANLQIDDRIELFYRCNGELSEAMEAWRAHIMQETLTVATTRVADGAAPDVDFHHDVKIEGQEIWLGLRRARR
jgi:isoleucyl-tRNA synthetase